MSVIIDIGEDGTVTATHNSGQVLWTYQVDAEGERVDTDLAQYIKEVVAEW